MHYSLQFAAAGQLLRHKSFPRNEVALSDAGKYCIVQRP